MSAIGQSITRADGPIKVTGAARYSGDQNMPGQVYAVFVAASVPAGRVTSVDTRAALAMPGVIRVLVAADMPRVHADLDKITVPPLATRFMPMQTDAVMHEGQPVAILLAENLEAAEAAATKVQVTYQRQTFIVPEKASPQPADPQKGFYSKASALEFSKGNAASAIEGSPIKIRAEYTQLSRHANPMEPSAILATWSGIRLTVYDAVQHLASVQGVLAAAFGLKADNVRVVAPHTGGGFGAKAFIWPHEILAAMASMVVRRPVKLVLSRQHMYGMVGPQPQMTHEVRLGASDSGKLMGITHLAVNVTGVTDDYVEFGSIPGRSFYACDNITTSQRVQRGNMTLPTFMRSPWDGPGSWALGSAMDELARQVNIDPLTVIVAILVGSSLLGLMGAVLAVPLAAVIRILIIRVLAPAIRDALGATPTTDAPPVAVE